MAHVFIEQEEIDELEELDDLFPIRGERIVRERIDHFQRHSDQEFRKRFRISKNVFRELLAEIEDEIRPPSQR